MKRTAPTRSRQRKEAGYLLPAIGLAAACLVSLVLAEIPAWWSGRGLVKKNAAGQPVEASDFAAANQGQLKNVAIATYEEFLARIPAELGGTGANDGPPNPNLPESPANRAKPGWRIRHLVSQWVVLNPDGTVQRANGQRVLTAGATTQKDFAAINLGQIKVVAAPFYDRLAELYWSFNSGTPSTSQIDPAWAKPWTDDPADANDHAMATLGQLKNTFAIHLDSDGDGDGLTNLAELLANKARSDASGNGPLSWTDLGNAYSSGGVITDGDQVGLGLDPTDPANGVPPAAPTGLHITFRDADEHPEDPDLSQINVEWDVPPQPGISVSFSSTHAGSPDGWISGAFAGSKSADITVPNSKRVYEYRVTFTGPNHLSSSSEITYELPVIRGIMQRQIDTEMNFPVTYLNPNPGVDGTPRKFRSVDYTWQFDSTDQTVITVDATSSTTTVTAYSDGAYSFASHPSDRHLEVSAEAHEIYNTVLPDDSKGYSWTHHLTHESDFIEPSAKNPSGSFILDSSEDDDMGTPASHTRHFDLGFGVQVFQEKDASGDAVEPLPFSGFTATEKGYDLSGLKSGDEWNEYSWDTSASIPDLASAQHLAWMGKDLSIDKQPGEPETMKEGPRNYGSIGYQIPEHPEYTSGSFYNSFVYGDAMWKKLTYVGYGDFPPDGVTASIETDGTSWTRYYTHSDSHTEGNTTYTHTETWTETVTLSDEITSEELVNAAVANQGSPGAGNGPLEDIGWTSPDILEQWRLTNQVLVNEYGLDFTKLQFGGNSSMLWNCTNSYGSITATQLVSASAPGQSHVMLQPQYGTTVGAYHLSVGESSGHLLSSEYKFRFYPPAESCTVSWLETFTPDSSEARQIPQYKLRSYDVSANQTDIPGSDLFAVDRTEGWTRQVPSTASPQLAQVVQTGKLKGTVSIGPVPPMEILQPVLGPDGNVVKQPNGDDQLAPVTSVRFCRWSNAFNPASAFRPRFEMADKDRFYIRFMLPEAAELKVGTHSLSGLYTGETADAPVPMSTDPDAASSNVWKSMAMILVTDREDDTTYNSPATSDNQSDDSTRLGSPGAMVLAFLSGKGLGVNKPVARPQGKVRLRIRLLYDPGDPAVTAEKLNTEKLEIRRDFLIARQIYAQIGVQLELVSVLQVAVDREEKALLKDGVLTYDPNNETRPGTEYRYFIDHLPKTTGLTEIPITYIRAEIKSIFYEIDKISHRGFTMPEGSLRVGSIVISQPKAAYLTLAHEVGHALGLDHVNENVHIKHRLMTAKGTIYEQKYDDSKRFSQIEENIIKAPHRFYVPIP